ncbi:hypothetical protein CALCODRAFT_557222 [Calocera cornea HHB12733]|uniref:Uncharacterized protein n=1 Tax=Calocera cornea HHB12733 TaxID=1353952 RepID=A0A165E345_9BASI|nr:hypothetical protein CALCODRAFT_557222 [Calocera cornea HHB12733]
MDELPVPSSPPSPSNPTVMASDGEKEKKRPRKRARHARSQAKLAEKRADYVAYAQELGLGDNDIHLLDTLPTLFIKKPRSAERSREMLEEAYPGWEAEVPTFTTAPADWDWVAVLDPEKPRPAAWLMDNPVVRIDDGFGKHINTLSHLLQEFYAANPKEYASARDANSRSPYPGYHFGVWRKYQIDARFTKDTTEQDIRAKSYINAMAAIFSEAVGDRVKQLMRARWPELLEERERILEYSYSLPDIAEEIRQRPALRQGAWHVLAVREGAASIPHIDVGDDHHQFTVIFVLGDFVGGDLVFPDLKLRVPLRPGQILFLNTRRVAHYALPFKGTRDYRKAKAAEEEEEKGKGKAE